jgi:tRNA (mo5U34)-methyltransferase
MTSEELKSQVAKIKWHHSIDLGQGVVTPGQDNSAKKLARLQFPDSFAGKSVLDIGAWDGFFSFEAERRGAKRVLATDSFVWRGGCDWADKSGFDLSKRVLGSKVEEKEIDVLELSPENVGTFDVVFFLGVLYHMKHPLLELERVASVARDFLVL